MIRIENPEKDAHKYAQLIFYEDAKKFSEVKIAFSTTGVGATGYP